MRPLARRATTVLAAGGAGAAALVLLLSPLLSGLDHPASPRVSPEVTATGTRPAFVHPTPGHLFDDPFDHPRVELRGGPARPGIPPWLGWEPFPLPHWFSAPGGGSWGPEAWVDRILLDPPAHPIRPAP